MSTKVTFQAANKSGSPYSITHRRPNKLHTPMSIKKGLEGGGDYRLNSLHRTENNVALCIR